MPAALPGDAHRHRPQLPRGARPSATEWSSGSGPGSWSRRCRIDRRRARGRGDGPPCQPQPAADRHAPATRSRSSGSTRCSAAHVATRRRRGPRSASSRFRDDFGQWDPKNQRPELWSLYNGRHRKGEHIRVFPLSNWTELDIWQYIADEAIALPSIYFAHRREVFQRDGMWLDDSDRDPTAPRRRGAKSAWCATARWATSPAPGRSSRPPPPSPTSSPRWPPRGITERGATRADDRISEAAMEDRKREGYF